MIWTGKARVDHHHQVHVPLAIQRRVDLMFDKIRKLIVQYLDPNEVDEIGDQVRAAKDAAVPERGA